MPTFAIKDASGVTLYFEASGAGTIGDPFVPTHAVTGPLTDTELRATPVPVSIASVDLISGFSIEINDTARTEVIPAQGVGVKLYITHLLVQNSSETVGTWVTIEDGTTGKYKIFCAPNGGGASITLPNPIVTSANAALNASCATTAANVIVNASGYKGA